MAGDELTALKVEISHYIGIPYFINAGKYKNHGDNVTVGKGTAKEIALKTVELANNQNLKLINFNPAEIYNFQKKNHLGIDCSGLACHLLNFYFHTELDVRHTSADKLTSSPLSQEIRSAEVTTGDLVRQKLGKHVLFVIEKEGDTIYYVDSSREGRGVRYGQFSLTDKDFLYDGFFRLKLFSV